METNQNPAQENPAQCIALELEQPAERLYDPAEAARIVQCLTDGYFDPNISYCSVNWSVARRTATRWLMTCLS